MIELFLIFAVLVLIWGRVLHTRQTHRIARLFYDQGRPRL